MATSTFVPIATQTLGSAVSSITFSSIPSGYTDLFLEINGVTSSSTDMTMVFNSDTGINYSFTEIYGNGASVGSAYGPNNGSIALGNNISTSATYPFLLKINIFSYTGSTNKSALVEFAADNNGGGGVEIFANLWRNTSAINNIKIATYAGNLNIGTTATLWGI